MSNSLIIIGASGHGKVIADAARLSGWEDVSFLDDNEALVGTSTNSVLGVVSDATRYPEAEFIVAIGDARVRQRIQSWLELLGMSIATVVHPRSVVAQNAVLGPGSVVLAGGILNVGATIGRGCIINTAASVDHDCTIGNYSHVSVGSHVAGTVRLGDRVWLGIGSSVSNNLFVCSDAVIGAGATVVCDIKNPGTYIGTPASRVSVGAAE